MLLPAFIVSLAKHSPVQLGEKAFTKGRTFCVVEWKTVSYTHLTLPTIYSV